MFLRASLILLALLLSPALAQAIELSGTARILDGDTLELAGEKLRLIGIDAPETRQTCYDGAHLIYGCGRRATAALTEMIGGGELRCDAGKRDRYRRLLAVCFAGEIEINREMVRRGWALAYITSTYRGEQAEARGLRAGLWAGDFTPPADYRRAAKRS